MCNEEHIILSFDTSNKQVKSNNTDGWESRPTYHIYTYLRANDCSARMYRFQCQLPLRLIGDVILKIDHLKM